MQLQQPFQSLTFTAIQPERDAKQGPIPTGALQESRRELGADNLLLETQAPAAVAPQLIPEVPRLDIQRAAAALAHLAVTDVVAYGVAAANLALYGVVADRVVRK